jgi:Asp-tRNA(Asn)/Glu-tRNA(Gln) amidotransferase A subunit family amidase
MRGVESKARCFRVAFSPKLGNFPVDDDVSIVVQRAVNALRRAGVVVDEVELNFGADHDALARLWIRLIAVHYAAIARHWKVNRVDLLDEDPSKLTPQFRQMLLEAQTITAVDHSLDDVLRTGVFVGLQAVFEGYDLIVSPTLAVPAIQNASDGNTIGPTEISGKRVEPLIGWCMTYPINFTGHPAISIPAGFTNDGFPVGLQIIGRRHADETVLALASLFEQTQPWFERYPGLLASKQAA